MKTQSLVFLFLFPLPALAESPILLASPPVAPAAQETSKAAAAHPVQTTTSASVLATSSSPFSIGGQVRLLNTLMNSDDRSKHQNYPFALDRTRLWAKREQNGVEGYIQFRFESNQNGPDNESTPASTTSFVDVNRAYLNFKSVAEGLDLQLGKQVYKFADDSDYGLTKTDAYEFFAKPNTDYGLGLFADYRFPNSLGAVHLAITNGNAKSNFENNSQKAVVGFLSFDPLVVAGSSAQGMRTSAGYAVNVLKKDGDRNVLDSVLTLGLASKPSLTFVELGVEYNQRKTSRDGKLYGDTSGSGLALRAGYKWDALNFALIYSQLKREFEVEQTKGFFGGKLESASKSANGSSVLAVTEYKIGPSVLGLQYKLRSNDAKIYKDKAGKEAHKSADDLKFYATVSF